jgi:hypothetical protein
LDRVIAISRLRKALVYKFFAVLNDDAGNHQGQQVINAAYRNFNAS